MRGILYSRYCNTRYIVKNHVTKLHEIGSYGLFSLKSLNSTRLGRTAIATSILSFCPIVMVLFGKYILYYIQHLLDVLAR
jgi:hypothetical protein